MPFSAGPAWNIFPLSPHYKKKSKNSLRHKREFYFVPDLSKPSAASAVSAAVSAERAVGAVF